MLGESFGSCLALRCALAVPELLSDLVLINSATSFDQSLFGLAAVVSSSNLLSFFPESLYNTAQVRVLARILLLLFMVYIPCAPLQNGGNQN